MKKIYQVVAGILLVVGVVGFIVFDRLIYPVSLHLPGAKPWSNYPGTACTFSGCYESEKNKVYAYYLDLAVAQKDPGLCRNVKGRDHGDYSDSRELTIYFCKAEYGGRIGDLQFCNSLDTFTKYQGTRSQRDSCLTTMMNTYVEDESLCEEFPADSKYASPSHCFAAVAYKKADIAICEEIPEVPESKAFLRKSCIERVQEKIEKNYKY